MLSINLYAKFARCSLITLWAAFIMALIISIICHYMGIAGTLKSSANVVCFVLGLPLLVTIQYVHDAVDKVAGQLQVTLDDGVRRRIAPIASQLGSETQIGYYPSAEINAFAISSVFGKKALIAFSTGLLQVANDRQLVAIAAHEIAHINNGDSRNKAFILAFSHAVRMYPCMLSELSKGVLRKFAYVFSIMGAIVAALAFIFPEARDNFAGLLPVLWTFVRILAWPAGMIAVYFVLNRLLEQAYSAYSREREFAADEGGAAMTSTQELISALSLLSDGESQIVSVFDTHPPLAARKKRLGDRIRENSLEIQ
ncbi:Zn-dependent protease with chaperone function [Massilia sp. UYP32]|jgi:Zn-dependent protease with chaperone function|uniref:Peptidase M48 domain-containing protein n=2 Tax=Massilia timonae TaxID=47229 RepID=K9D5U9_9BURK|nr:M48 family metalloprotease [Massilia timonae]EKU79658.1 hypothetical protein HMPREF9710_05140 [Massilia timonae CCUG 45783]HAK90371.1 hypothetical protein [Massilia timonae]